MTEPAFMRSTAAWPMMRGAALPGTEAVLITASLAAMRASRTSCCLSFLLRRQFARIAAGAFGGHAGVDELGSEGFHLVLGCATHVIRFDHGA